MSIATDDRQAEHRASTCAFDAQAVEFAGIIDMSASDDFSRRHMWAVDYGETDDATEAMSVVGEYDGARSLVHVLDFGERACAPANLHRKKW